MCQTSLKKTAPVTAKKRIIGEKIKLIAPVNSSHIPGSLNFLFFLPKTQQAEIILTIKTSVSAMIVSTGPSTDAPCLT